MEMGTMLVAETSSVPATNSARVSCTCENISTLSASYYRFVSTTKLNNGY